MIAENEVEAALDYMRDHAEEAAMARANRIYMQEYRKVWKAEIMKEHIDKPVNAQEREAYADQRYKDHLDAMKEAIRVDERLGFLLTAAEAKVKAWQTFSANSRPKL